MDRLSPRRGLTVLALGAGLAAALAGCTHTDPETQGETPSPTPTSTAAAQAPTLSCDDGFLLVDADQVERGTPIEVTEPCATVSVVGTAGTVTLGDVEQLVLEGDALNVVVDSVTRIAFAGDDDTVQYGGDSPEIDDQGDGNVALPL